MNFENLKTEKFRKKMQPYAISIYQSIFKNCKYSRQLDINKDKHYSIDATLILEDGQKITIQEKFRNFDCLVNKRLQDNPPFPDFTQEYKNAAGTKYEVDGEFFKLYAQLYFYGWANKNETGIIRWALIDIPKYKNLLFEKGIDNLGTKRFNSKHGKASFYTIPINLLEDCFLYTNFNFHK